MCFEDGQHVRRNRNGVLPGVGLRGASKACVFRAVQRVGPNGDRTGVQVNVFRAQGDDLAATSPHHAPSRTAARYRGVIASMSAATWATEATGRSLARSVPAPGMLAGLAGIALSRTAAARTP